MKDKPYARRSIDVDSAETLPMSLTSPIPPLDNDGPDWLSKGCSGLTQQFCGVSRFVRGFTTQLRFGRLSRSPLQLARLLIREDRSECDWIARDRDPWDADLSREVGKRHASLQALKDAIDIRALLFATLPEVSRARLRVYRRFSHQAPELIIIGNVRRDESAHRGVHSLAMRAKLIGLRFDLEEGLLRGLSREEHFHFSD